MWCIVRVCILYLHYNHFLGVRQAFFVIFYKYLHYCIYSAGYCGNKKWRGVAGTKLRIADAARVAMFAGSQQCGGHNSFLRRGDDRKRGDVC